MRALLEKTLNTNDPVLVGVVEASAYTKIVAIVTGTPLQAGSVQGISVVIKNTFVVPVNVACVATVKGKTILDTRGKSTLIAEGAEKYFSGTFLVPSGQLVIDAYSYYLDTTGQWIQDDYMQITPRTVNRLQQYSLRLTSPSLTIQNPSIKSGDSLSFSFTGFPANKAISVWAAINAAQPITTAITVTSDASGSGSGTLQVKAVKGSYILYAEDTVSLAYASANFAITAISTVPELIIMGTGAFVNNLVAIQAGGKLVVDLFYFTPNATVTFTFDKPATPSSFTAKVGSDGSLQYTFSKVIAVPGTYTLTAKDTAGKTDSDQFAVAEPPTTSQPALTIVNPSIKSGGLLVFTFSGFSPNSVVTVTSSGTVSGTSAWPADSNGSGGGNVNFTGAVGNYTLTATDTAGNTKTAGFTIVTGGPTVAIVPGADNPKKITYKISGFPGNDALTLTVGMYQQTPVYTTTLTTAGDGMATGTLDASSYANGTYLITVADIAGNEAVNSFTVSGQTVTPGDNTGATTPSWLKAVEYGSIAIGIVGAALLVSSLVGAFKK